MAEQAASAISQGLVEAIGARFEQAHDRNLDKRTGAIDALVTQWLEGHEQDLAALVKPHLAELLNDPSLPPVVKNLFTTLSGPEHQTQFFTALFAIQGIINSFVNAALQPYVQEVSNTAWSHDTSMVLTPQEVALADIRNELQGVEPIGEVMQSGINTQRYNILRAITGEPPGLQALNEAYRRDIIDTTRLERGIRQSRVRDEWIDVIEALRYAPPSPAEVLRGAIQNHLPDAEARKLYMEGGYNPGNYDWQYETAGRPPGIQELIELLRRGEIDEATLIQAIRESDYKDKYIGAIIKMQRHVPPERTIVSGVRQGVLTDEQGHELLGLLGIQPQDAHWLLQEAHAAKTIAQKDLSLSTIKAIYADGGFSREQAHTKIVALRYDDTEADEILGTVDMMREHRYRQAALARVHNLYVTYRLIKSDAITDMDKLGIDGNERDHIIKLWDLEREANTKDLTLAQLTAMWKHKILGDNDYLKHVMQIGYVREDADNLLALLKPIPKDKATA